MRPPLNRMERAARGGYILLGLGVTLIGAALPSLVRELGQGYTVLSGLLVAAAAGTTIAYVTGNRLVDRVRAERVLRAGFIIFLLGALPLPFVPIYGVWLAAVFVVGFALSLIDVSGARIVSSLHRGEEGPALNALNTFFAIGAVLGPPVVALSGALGLTTGWAWLASGILALLGLAAASGGWSGDPMTIQPALGPLPSPTAATGWIWLLTAAMFVYTASEAGFGSWFAAFVHQTAGVPSWEAALFVTVFWAGFVPSRLVVARRMATWKLERLIVLGALLGGSGEAAAALLGQTIWGALGGAFVAGFGFGPCFPAMLALAGQGAPGREGWSFGRLYSALAIAFLVAPWVEGRVFGFSPVLAVMMMAVLAMTVGVIVALFRLPPAPDFPTADRKMA